MKNVLKGIFAGISMAGLCLVFNSASSSAADEMKLTEEKDKVSYSLGYQIGSDMKRQEVEINPQLLLQGVQHGAGEVDPLMSDDEMRQTLIALKQKVVAQQQQKAQEMKEENLRKGQDFLAANKTREGVVALPSGLQYKILVEGEGGSPKATDMVKVHYRGTLIDGSEFDNSIKRGQPAQFRLNQVIPGWTEALQLMKVGGKWQLFIPAELAYGERGASNLIGPNSTLIFEVELLEIASAEKQ